MSRPSFLKLVAHAPNGYTSTSHPSALSVRDSSASARGATAAQVRPARERTRRAVTIGDEEVASILSQREKICELNIRVGSEENFGEAEGSIVHGSSVCSAGGVTGCASLTGSGCEIGSAEAAVLVGSISAAAAAKAALTAVGRSSSFSDGGRPVVEAHELARERPPPPSELRLPERPRASILLWSAVSAIVLTAAITCVMARTLPQRRCESDLLSGGSGATWSAEPSSAASSATSAASTPPPAGSFSAAASPAFFASAASSSPCCSSSSAGTGSESRRPGNQSSGSRRVRNPTGSETMPMTRHTIHCPPVRFWNPIAGPTTVRPTASMKSTWITIVAAMMRMNMSLFQMSAKMFLSSILREFTSEKICIKTKALKMMELISRVVPGQSSPAAAWPWSRSLQGRSKISFPANKRTRHTMSW
mmetsp:Transcript_19954/g.64967  ORF Transcript_19954/g.64967 Transcript_19954/m.64967 type:complete len:421 (-) Transcript_19954:2520-3782(-)